MDVLTIGASNVFAKRVLPALLSSPRVGRIHVASRRPSVDLAIEPARAGRVFHGYDAALRELEPCVAYVTLPNALHAEWTRRALEAGFHVIVDKPAFLSLDDAESLLALAERRGLCLAEATVWAFHPQVRLAIEAFATAGSSPTAVQATFAFPRPAAENFRNVASLGGGAFNDLCAYAVSPGRVFFDADPIDVSCRRVCADPDGGIDTAFALTMTYPGGRVFQGFYAFGMEYQNRITALGPGVAVALEPAFTSRRQASHGVSVRTRDAIETRAAAPGDSFAEFFAAVLESIERGACQQWGSLLRRDAVAAHLAATQAGIARHAN